MENLSVTNKILGVERDIVLMSLYSYHTNLILSSKNDKPKIISPQNFSIPAQNLIFISKNFFLSTLPNYEENTEITVCFFYQGRGIFFKTVPKTATTGYGLIIPQILYKQQDKNQKQDYQVTGKLFYTGKEEKGRFLSCFSNSKYPLFTPFLWQYFSEAELFASAKLLFEIARVEICSKDADLEKCFTSQQKILYLPEGKLPNKVYFPYEATFTSQDSFDVYMDFGKEVYIPILDKSKGEKIPHSICNIVQDSVTISPLEIEDSVSSFPICRFLAADNEEVEIIQGRAAPLEILYINDGMVILGLKQGDFPLQRGNEYPLSLFINLPIGKREVFLTVFVSRVFEYSGNNNKTRTAAVCRYTSIKEEDRRFLFEKLYNSRYM